MRGHIGSEPRWGAWGPSTWGPSPEQETEEERRLRAQERAGAIRTWFWVLAAFGCTFVILGPWLGFLTPSASETYKAICSSFYAQGQTIIYNAQPDVFTGGQLTVGNPAKLVLKSGRVVAVVVPFPPTFPAPGTTTVDVIIDSLSPGTDQIEGTLINASGGMEGTAGASGSVSSPRPCR